MSIEHILEKNIFQISEARSEENRSVLEIEAINKKTKAMINIVVESKRFTPQELRRYVEMTERIIDMLLIRKNLVALKSHIKDKSIKHLTLSNSQHFGLEFFEYEVLGVDAKEALKRYDKNISLKDLDIDKDALYMEGFINPNMYIEDYTYYILVSKSDKDTVKEYIDKLESFGFVNANDNFNQEAHYDVEKLKKDMSVNDKEKRDLLQFPIDITMSLEDYKISFFRTQEKERYPIQYIYVRDLEEKNGEIFLQKNVWVFKLTIQREKTMAKFLDAVEKNDIEMAKSLIL